GNSRVSLINAGNLADEATVSQIYSAVPRLWASLHLVGGFAAAPVAATDKTALMAQMEKNFVTCFLCCRAAAATMKANGGGRMVNVATRPALEWRLGANMAAYTASKAAVVAFTSAFAQEVVDQGILVNAVAPSIMDTPPNRKDQPNADYSKWPKVEE